MPMIRIGQQFERGAPLAVPIERQAVPFGFVRRDRQRLRKRARRIERRHLGRECALPRSGPTQPIAMPFAGQPLVGVVGAQRQPVFGARGEHPVRLGDAARDQIVDHHAEIAFGAVEDDRRRRRPPARPH